LTLIPLYRSNPKPRFAFQYLLKSEESVVSCR
jgi:hypothetical protein